MNIEKATIGSIKKNRIVKTGETFLDVEINLHEASKRTDRQGKVVKTVRRGYPFDTSVKVIEKDIKKLLKTLNKESKRAVKNAKLEADEATADQTIKNLEGLEVRKA